MFLNGFFENLIKLDKKPAVLRILPGFAEKLRTKSLDNPYGFLKILYLVSCLIMPLKSL